MPAPLNLLEKFATLTLNIVPSPMLDLVGGFSFYAVSAAIRLNVFDELGEESLSAGELSGKLACDARGLAILLDVLESLGYVVRTKDGYRNSRIAKKWLQGRTGINYARGFTYYHPTMIDIFPHLDKSLKKGNPHVNFYQWLGKNPDVVDDYQTFMMSLGKQAIPSIVKNIQLKDEKVLDIGGSHGLYSIALCEAYPHCSVSIIDSKYAMPLLKKNIGAAGMHKRIRLIIGDFLKHPFKEKYDAVLLFNVLHEHAADYNRKIIEKITHILSPGGRLIILEGLSDKQPTRIMNLGSRIYSLMFYHFLGGQCYASREIREWLSAAGFKKIHRKNFYSSGFSLITGSR